MIERVPNCGQYGVNNDLSQHELPINVWTDAQNIRFLDGYVNQVLGYGEVYGTPSITPHHVLPVIIAGARYWIYASLAKIYCTTITAGAAVHTNLTRQTAGNDVDYTATANSWTSAVLGGVPILNPGNATDVPQFWDLNTANNFAALTNWPASTYCKSMRAYKNSLVALNITKSSTNYPYMIKWSHPAVPGAVPSSWDETDPALDAGEFDLAEGYDHIIDGLTLGDSLIVYKEASVWRIDYTGGQSIYSTRKVLGTSGAMNRNCIVEIDGFHVVLTNNDIVIHDGTQAVSVLDKTTRRWLFQNIDVDEFSRCFVFKNPFFNEVSICYPSIGADYCDSAIVYNYVDKTISKRAMPNVHHANYGQVENSLVGTWAVAVLFLFVVMMLDIIPAKNSTTAMRWHRVEHLARVFLRLTGTLVLYLSFSGAMIRALEWGIQISVFSESIASISGIKACLYIFAGITSYAVVRYGFGISLFKMFQAFIEALPLSSIPGFVILAELSYVIAHWESFDLKETMILAPAPNPRQVTNTHALGKIIYTDYVFFLETAGLILLVAVIGAIVLTHRKREGVKRQDVRHQVARRKDDTLRLHDIPVGKGV